MAEPEAAPEPVQEEAPHPKSALEALAKHSAPEPEVTPEAEVASEPEAAPEPTPAPAADADPNRKMTPEEIAALFANM